MKNKKELIEHENDNECSNNNNFKELESLLENLIKTLYFNVSPNKFEKIDPEPKMIILGLEIFII